MNIFEYTDYREFLLDRIAFEKLNFERFAKKYPDHIAKFTVKKLLGKNRISSAFSGTYNMSNERFTELLYDLRPKLTEDQIYYLTILKITQEGSRSEHRSKMAKLLLRRAIHNEDGHKSRKERFTTTALDLALEGISLLPQGTRKTIENELLTRLVTNLMRFGDAAEVVRMIKKIRSHITR